MLLQRARGIDLRVVWGVAVTIVLTVAVWRSLSGGLLDLRVYLVGGEVWRDGGDLYGKSFPGPAGLPFTYPPFAAALFSVFTHVSLPVAAFLWTAAGVALFTVACQAAARHSDITVPRAGFGLAAVALLLFEPLRGTLDLGQINLVLIGLVAADCLLPRTPWPRGLLVGVAAAIKLTPAIFVLFFLSRRQWRPALTAVLSFVACGLVGWMLAPRDSAKFWFDAMLDPHRVGGLAYTSNQSIKGMLFRMGADGPLWILLCLLTVAALVVFLPRIKNDLAAVIAVAATGLLVSPVSWSHHWVWIAPALLLLHGWARVAVAAVFAVGPFWLLPATADRELRWTWWQHLIGNTYVLLAIALLVYLYVRSSTQQHPAGVAGRSSIGTSAAASISASTRVRSAGPR